MLVEVIEVDNQYYIDHTQIVPFDIKIGEEVLLADIAEYVYDMESLADEYEEWVRNNTEEYLDQLWLSYGAE